MKLDKRFPGPSSCSMYRQHTGNNFTIMVSKPPKPPSWRDFEPSTDTTKPPLQASKSQPSTSKVSSVKKQPSGSSKRTKDLEFTDLSRSQQKSYSEGSDLSKLGIGPSHYNLHPHMGHSHTLPNPHTGSKSHKRHRSHGRLHRTRSQYNIDNGDLPRIENMTVSLAETKPKEFGLKRRPDVFDPRLYLDENSKRCERWLEQVQASQPLEDVDFSKGSGVEVEIPEEGWEELELLKAPPATDTCPPNSGSGSEIDSVSVCAVHRPDLSQQEREAHIRLPVHKPISSSYANHLSKKSFLKKKHLAQSLEVLSSPKMEEIAGSTTAQVLTPPSPKQSQRKDQNRKKPRERSKDSGKTSPRKVGVSYKENRHPGSGKSSTSSENNNQARSNKKKGNEMPKDSETAGGEVALHQYVPGYISREEDFTKDIQLNFNR